MTAGIVRQAPVRVRVRLKVSAAGVVMAAFVTALLLPATPVEAQFETPNRQFHNTTTFPLDGRHRDLPCASCHIKNAYKGTPAKCVDCHWVRRQDDRFRGDGDDNQDRFERRAVSSRIIERSR